MYSALGSVICGLFCYKSDDHYGFWIGEVGLSLAFIIWFCFMFVLEFASLKMRIED